MLAALTLCLALQNSGAGAVAAPRVQALQVFVVDEAGTLLVDGWSVRRGRWSGTTLDWVETARVDATSGVATFAALTEPTCVVQALHDTGELSDREQIALGPPSDGTNLTVHGLVFEGPTPERSLFVTLQGSIGLESEGGPALVAIDRAGVEVALRQDPDARGRYVARGVEPGSYRIELRDARYLPVLLERHATGRAASVQATGSATLVVEFVDALDGHALAVLDGNTVTSVASGSGTNITAIAFLSGRAAGAGRSGPTRVEGVVPGTTVSLQATFARHLAATLELTDIAPFETRRITCRVDRARTVSGTVLDPTGAPVAGVPVEIEGGTSGGSSSRRVRRHFVTNAQWTVLQGSGGQLATLQGSGGPGFGQVVINGPMTVVSGQTSGASGFTCITDDEGRFELHGLGSGPTQLVAHFTPWHQESIPLPALTAPTPPDAAATSGETHAWAGIDDASPLALRAPGACGADLEFVLPWGMTLAHFELSLQVGDDPALDTADKRAPLVDEHQTMRLRGLLAAPCRLVVWRRGQLLLTPLAPHFEPPLKTIEFVPRAGAPTVVRVDLTPFAEPQ